MQKFFGLMLLCATTVCLTSCLGSNSSRPRVEDDKYLESLDRERALKDAGMDDAAAIERNARREYMKGGDIRLRMVVSRCTTMVQKNKSLI